MCGDTSARHGRDLLLMTSLKAAHHREQQLAAAVRAQTESGLTTQIFPHRKQEGIWQRCQVFVKEAQNKQWVLDNVHQNDKDGACSKNTAQWEWLRGKMSWIVGWATKIWDNDYWPGRPSAKKYSRIAPVHFLCARPHSHDAMIFCLKPRLLYFFSWVYAILAVFKNSVKSVNWI